jgi:nucleotide-binding universal stress UspA family protein
LARAVGAEVSVIHVAAKDETVDEADRLVEFCEVTQQDSHTRCELRKVIRRGGDFVQQILDEAKAIAADLMVIGSTHHLLADETISENTSEILRNSPCPVITVSEVSKLDDGITPSGH